ncbi:hypothetical protein [Siphonobacter sp. SORGH_AS_0500]|uniref:hypothetical protein n=1 Tax=Siphonobacter sp. SORGH_AS_0500 TaxID=1864824 RepID=UPI0012FF4AAE|nr:hypothetical protein [Siphonobacter sp. SORGH_AS_0500]
MTSLQNTIFRETFEQFLWQEMEGEDWVKAGEGRYENEARQLAIALNVERDKIVLLQELDFYERRGWQVIQLWQDVWENQPSIVKSRLKSLLGKSARIPGRLTFIKPIESDFFKEFLKKNHLQDSAKCPYRYGLFLKNKPQNQLFLNDPTIVNDCVAVAGFGPVRFMPGRGENYYSGELIRFSNVLNHTVVGGLDKLIKAFLREHPVQDLMTYADRDWSTGKSYERLGFKRVGTTLPQEFWLDLKTNIRHYPHRLKKDFSGEFREVYNSGNYKYIKFLS